MYNTMMYQPPVLIQLTDSQVQRIDNSANYTKRENSGAGAHCGRYNYNGRSSGKKQTHTYYRREDGTVQSVYVQNEYGHYNYHGRCNGKAVNNGYNRNLRVLSGSQQGLSQSQETLYPSSLSLSRDSVTTDSSTEDLSDPSNKGVKIVPDRYLARSQQMEVKEVPERLKTGSRWDQLSTDIWRKFMANQQTSESYIKKMNLFKYLYTNIKVMLRYSVFVVGSTLNGFGTNSSDLDLCLVTRNNQTLDLRADAIQHLLNTHELFKSLDYIGSEFQKLELIEAKVPLLKFHHSLGVDVDVNCNNPVGIRNTHLLHCYAKADWRVQPLVLVVKLWAQAHQINDAKNMTISSYSLALMVIHFLQCGTHPAVLPCLQLDFPEKFREDQEIHNINMLETLNLPPTANTQSLGELLLQFYHYYNYFQFTEYAISVRLGTTLPVENCRRYPSPKNEPRAWSFLCIEEPFDHTNTGRAVYDQEKFEHIRKVFQQSYQRLKETRSLSSIFHLKVTT